MNRSGFLPYRFGLFGLFVEVCVLVRFDLTPLYGAIAKYIGAARSSRMVGWCMNNAHAVKPKVPAHRVVNRNGLLTGKHHFATPAHMEELLMKEGVKVKNDQVVDFAKKFWDPAVELEL